MLFYYSKIDVGASIEKRGAS